MLLPHKGLHIKIFLKKSIEPQYFHGTVKIYHINKKFKKVNNTPSQHFAHNILRHTLYFIEHTNLFQEVKIVLRIHIPKVITEISSQLFLTSNITPNEDTLSTYIRL